MTMGTENPGSVATGTQERFAGQLGYRGARRDGELAESDSVARPDLGARTDLGQRPDAGPRNGVTPGLETASPHAIDAGPRPSLADLDDLAEPVFPSSWLDGAAGVGPGLSLADHPLLRGLLLELPPKGTAPAPGWLDRWFEAARCILELLYLQDSVRPRG